MARPSKFQGDICRQAALLCELGATDAMLAQFFQVSESTINEWKLSKPGFSESLKSAKEIADAQVEESLFNRARGYSHEAVKIMQHEGSVITEPYTEHYPPDTTACIFWLKNRQPAKWRDRQEHEHTGKDGASIVPIINVTVGSLGENK